jgi:hypothetical protein
MYGLGSMTLMTGKQVEDRIRVMFQQVAKSIRDPLARTLAAQMIRQADCPAQNRSPISKVKIDECQIKALYWGVKRNGMYIGDVRDIDTYQTVRRSLELGMAPSPILAAAVGVMRGQVRDMYEQALRAFGTPAGPQFIFDCDDGTIIMCALGLSVGFRAGAKAISADGRMFGHVYPVYEIPRYVAGARQIVPLDLTEYEAHPGWEPPRSQRRAERIFWYQE